MQDVDVCNMSIGMCAGDEITSLEENTPLGLFCNTQYPQKRAFIMGLYRWVFTTRVQALSRIDLTDFPAGSRPAAYAFVKPTDILGVVHSYRDQAQVEGSRPISDVMESEGRYWSSSGAVWVEYTRNVDEGEWPAWFTELVKTAFAADVARKLQNTRLAQEYDAKAFGSTSEAGEGGLYAQARAADARAAPQRQLYAFDDGPLVGVRSEGVCFGFNGQFVSFP